MADFSKPYDSKTVEPDIYKRWLDSGYFAPENLPGERKEPYAIMMPPPNATGILHAGHALFLTIQDIMIRFQRMRGKKALWLPGTDHAAIATQARVEKDIQKKEDKNRYEIGREELLRRIDDFVAEHRAIMQGQMRAMGASADWSREAFTLDEPRNRAVVEAFKRFYELGLVYRGHRIINWDPRGQTTISDDEIVHEERPATLWTFRYGQDFPIAIATTRPETKVGDVAVAVHPDDERYRAFVGKEFDLTFAGVPLHIKIVADDAVDPAFGTGAVGVTPAHSLIDDEIAKRHGLVGAQVIDEQARLMVGGAELKGKKVAEARTVIVEWLRAEGLLEKEEATTQNIATAERTGGVIEPLPKLQWWINVNKEFVLPHSEIDGIKTGETVTLKQLMQHVVRSGQTRFVPDRFTETYFRWVDNLRDWCISRQIWYGHRVPVWYCTNCRETVVAPRVKARWHFVRHGESTWNTEGRTQGQSAEHNPLTEDGVLQVQRVGQALKNENIQLIISSDIQRCRETAEILAQATGAELVFEEGLRERKMGETEGMLREERNKKFGKSLFWQYDAGPNGGETWRELEERAWKAYQERSQAHGNMNVVVVTHGGLIMTIKKKMYGWDHEQMVTDGVPENANAFSVDVLDPCTQCGGDTFEQDPDTLDTWFSSGLWTFATLGWPDETEDLKTFHPTDVLETAYEILFFWVAKMILMSTSLVGQVPFRFVYLHGLVRDEKRQKLSKSKADSANPLDLIEKYGTDALRLALVFGTAPGTDSILAEQKIKGMKHFANKLWNVARFVTMNLDEGMTMNMPEPANLSAEDKKTLAELQTMVGETTRQLDEFKFYLAADTLYHYVWHTFADKIIEEQKPRLLDSTERALAQYVLTTILLHVLKLLHPFMPFITEAIWQGLPKEKESLLLVETWPS